MPLLTQYAIFFVSPFGEGSVCDELNHFIRSHRIVNVEKRLIDGERGTGWLFLIEYGNEAKSQPTNAQRIDYREVLNEQEYALFDRLRDVRKTISEKQGVPVYAVFTNEQLAAMVKKPPLNLKDILALPAAVLFASICGRGAASGTNRVKRGGSWNNNAANATVANRNNDNPENQNNNLGFRVVRP